MGLPKMHMAGDNLVLWSGVFLYRSMALWKVSTLMSPFLHTLSVISRLMVLTPISALQLLWGKATELSLWWIPQSDRNFLVECATNSGSPSDDSSSGMP